MDWEKQDNELRSLMAGTDFLPDGENWNVQERWNKLQQKKQPAKRKRIPVWVRLAAAACAVGLFGGGIWYIQSSHSFTKSGEEFVKQGSNQSVEPAKNINAKGTIPGSENLQETTREISDMLQPTPPYGVTGNERFIDGQTAIQHDKNAGSKRGEHNNQSVTQEKALVNETTDTKYDTGFAVVEPVLPEEVIPQTIVVVPAPALKSKPRVVHYNQLSGMQSTPPPAFVLTKKSYAEMDAFAMQPLSNQKEPPFQLKIDISPAPKKSL